MIDNKLNEVKVFKDPIHNYIKVENGIIWDLINTKEMQRLRRIKQLSGVSMVFHTAEHSRFSHSLGVYSLAYEVVNTVDGVKIMHERDRLALLCAALLHDLGHGPFSHSFEHIFNFDHELMTTKIITGDTQINAILKRKDEDFPQYIADIILKKSENKVLESLVSSQIDVDRADYLQRDSYFAGAKYGNIDMQRIIRIMRVKENKLVFKESGIHAIENYLTSRYQMYWQVYYHPVARCFELLLGKIFERFKALDNDGYKFKVSYDFICPILNKETCTLNQYLDLDDYVMTAFINRLIHEDDKIISDLADRFINRRLFENYDWKLDKEGLLPSKLQELEKVLDECGINSKYYSLSDYTAQDFYKQIKDSSQQILILKKDGSILPIEECSVVVEQLLNIKKKVDYRIYLPVELIDNLTSEQQEKIRVLL